MYKKDDLDPKDNLLDDLKKNMFSHHMVHPVWCKNSANICKVAFTQPVHVCNAFIYNMDHQASGLNPSGSLFVTGEHAALGAKYLWASPPT